MEPQDVSQLVGFLDNYTNGYLILSFLITMLGVLIHYVKKCIKMEADWNTYWSNHLGQTATAVMAAIGSYITVLMTESNSSLLTFMAIGYVVDSMFNKAPASTKKPSRRANDRREPNE